MDYRACATLNSIFRVATGLVEDDGGYRDLHPLAPGVADPMQRPALGGDLKSAQPFAVPLVAVLEAFNALL
jgi:hypothetical protein